MDRGERVQRAPAAGLFPADLVAPAGRAERHRVVCASPQTPHRWISRRRSSGGIPERLTLRLDGGQIERGGIMGPLSSRRSWKGAVP